MIEILYIIAGIALIVIWILIGILLKVVGVHDTQIQILKANQEDLERMLDIHEEDINAMR